METLKNTENNLETINEQLNKEFKDILALLQEKKEFEILNKLINVYFETKNNSYLRGFELGIK